MTKKNKDLLINISVCIITFVILFSLFEIVLRTIESKPRYSPDNAFTFYEYDEYLGWKNKINASGIFHTAETASYVEINSKGLREEEFGYDKPKDIKRILFFGDSFTWGYGINISDRFTDIFERIIQERASREYEVINMGTSGYGTDQEYLLLAQEGVKYAPDIIIFVYFWNDIRDVSRNQMYSYPRPFYVLKDGKLNLTNVPVPKREINWNERVENEKRSFIGYIDETLSSLRAYSFLRNRILSMNIARKAYYRLYGRYPYERYGEAAIMNQTQKVLDSILLESKHIANKQKAEFVLILLPSKEQVYKRADKADFEHLENFAETNGIEIIDLLPLLIEEGKNDRGIYFTLDSHLSKQGNSIVGEFIANKMIGKGIV